VVDLTDEVLRFPCELSLKVVGHWADDLQDHVLELVRPHVMAVEPEPQRARVSRGGRYLSVTLRVTIADRTRMHALYAALRDDERVLWAL
jgi:putative lipoic acid-binding regulatory protein